MGRTRREFQDSPEMRELAEEVLQFVTPWIPELEPDLIRFSLITSEKAKNAIPVISDSITKDWVKETAKQIWLVAIYQDDWYDWDRDRKEWELFTAMLKIKKVKQDILDYSFIIDAIGYGANWREANEKGTVLPRLTDDDTIAKMPVPMEDDEDSSFDPNEEADPLDELVEKPIPIKI